MKKKMHFNNENNKDGFRFIGSEFRKDEFTFISVKDFCEMIEKEGIKPDSKHKKSSIHWLNIVLRTEGLYEKLMASHYTCPNPHNSRELQELKSLYEQTKNQAVLMLLNRKLLEIFFKAPKARDFEFRFYRIAVDALNAGTLDNTLLEGTKKLCLKQFEDFKREISSFADSMDHKDMRLKLFSSLMYMKLLSTISILLMNNGVFDLPYIHVNRRGMRERDIIDNLIEHSLSDTTVLIVGESGTGKTGIAKTIHDMSKRRDKNFISINCAALHESSIESELFGHIKGAFTGAAKNRNGLIFEANGGTVFLDELAKMPLGLQAKLLKVLEDKKIRRLGDDKDIAIDVRFIAAVHPANLESKEGNFYILEDLKYRFGTHSRIMLPSLNERFAILDDSQKMIILSSALFQALRDSRVKDVLNVYGFKKCNPVFSIGAKSIIFNHSYTGNFRELVDCIIEAIFNAVFRLIFDQDKLILINKKREFSISEEDLQFLREKPSTETSINHIENSLTKLNDWLYVDKQGLVKNPITKIMDIGEKAAKLVVNCWLDIDPKKDTELSPRLKGELGKAYKNSDYQRINRYIKEMKRA